MLVTLGIWQKIDFCNEVLLMPSNTGLVAVPPEVDTDATLSFKPYALLKIVLASEFNVYSMHVFLVHLFIGQRMLEHT